MESLGKDTPQNETESKNTYTITLPKPKLSKKQKELCKFGYQQGFLHRNQITSFYPNPQYAENITTMLIEFGYIIPEKSAIYKKVYKNGRVKEVCQRYLFNKQLWESEQ